MAEAADRFALFSVAIDRNKLLEKVEVMDPSSASPHDVVEQLEERAAKHANDHGGRHTFEVHATAAGEDKGLTTFQVHAELDGFTEPQNAGGIIAQSMRHTEAMARIMTSSSISMQDRSNKFIDRLANRVEHLEDQRLEVLESMESLYINKAERDRETLKVIASEERKNLGAKKLLELAPSTLATIAPKIFGNNQMDAITAHAARDLFEGLNEKQMQAMIAVLPQEKQIAFFQMVKRLAQVDETNEEAAKEKKAKEEAAEQKAKEGAH